MAEVHDITQAAAAPSQTTPPRSAAHTSSGRRRWITGIAGALLMIGAVSGYVWTNTSHQSWTAVVNDMSVQVTVTECSDRACTIPVARSDAA